MRSIKSNIESIENEIVEILDSVIEWNGQDSEHYSEQCLKIRGVDLWADGRQLSEVVFLDGNWTLVDEEGYQYNRDTITLDYWSQIIEHIQRVNPHSDEAKVFPVIPYHGTVDLSEFPNFSSTGSSEGMKKQVYGMGAMLLRRGGYIYNVTPEPQIYIDVYDKDTDYELENEY